MLPASSRDANSAGGGESSTSGFSFAVLILLAAVAGTVAVAAHRPDRDDASFLQMARSTQLNPSLAVYSFDASLGGHFGRFRFAPYLLSSYELWTAWVDDVTNCGLFRTYYVIFPAVSAVLCVLLAFLFARWFLPARSALLAVGLFLLISLAWGEDHSAYGNRLFVRLFQGKCLLLAVPIPALMLAGIVGMRFPGWASRVLFFGSAVACLGVCSSGLIVAPIAGAIAVFSGIAAFDRRTVRTAAWLVGMLAYLLAAGLVLKWGARSIVPYAEIGEILGVELSLGSGLHTVLAFGVCGIGVLYLQPSANHRTLFLLIAVTLLVVFNPWLSPAIAAVSAANATWRVAWAAPMPLLLAVVVAGLLLAVPRPRSLGARLIAIAALAVFLSPNRPVLRKENGIRWALPGPTISPDYYATVEVMNAVRRLVQDPVVLAEDRIATWVPLAAPGMSLVMAGHEFPVMFRTVLPPADYDRRMELFSFANSTVPAPDDAGARAAGLFGDFKVNTLIIKTSSVSYCPLVKALAAQGRAPKRCVPINDFSILLF